MLLSNNISLHNAVSLMAQLSPEVINILVYNNIVSMELIKILSTPYSDVPHSLLYNTIETRIL